LVPFAMLALGAAIGSYEGGVHGGYWGAGVGGCGGILLAVIGFFVVERLRRRGS
jgi:hypothetical protein